MQGLLQGVGPVDQGQTGAAHLLDIAHQVKSGTPLPFAGLGVHANTGLALPLFDHDKRGGQCLAGGYQK